MPGPTNIPSSSQSAFKRFCKLIVRIVGVPAPPPPAPEEPYLPPFNMGDWVIYQGQTYSFPGQVCGITDDGQYNVRAIGTPEGYYRGMKHIFGRKQLESWSPPAHLNRPLRSPPQRI